MLNSTFVAGLSTNHKNDKLRFAWRDVERLGGEPHGLKTNLGIQLPSGIEALVGKVVAFELSGPQGGKYIATNLRLVEDAVRDMETALAVSTPKSALKRLAPARKLGEGDVIEITTPAESWKGEALEGDALPPISSKPVNSQIFESVPILGLTDITLWATPLLARFGLWLEDKFFLLMERIFGKKDRKPWNRRAF